MRRPRQKSHVVSGTPTSPHLAETVSVFSLTIGTPSSVAHTAHQTLPCIVPMIPSLLVARPHSRPRRLLFRFPSSGSRRRWWGGQRHSWKTLSAVARRRRGEENP